MAKIELEKGWLNRQLEEVHDEVKDWPPEWRILRTINASLVKDSGSRTKLKPQKSEDMSGEL